MSSLQNVAMREIHMIVHTHFPKLCILHSPLIHVLHAHIKMHKLKMILPIILHAKPNHAKECMQALIPQSIVRHHMTPNITGPNGVYSIGEIEAARVMCQSE